MKKRIFLLLLIVPVFLAGCAAPKNELTNLSEVNLESGQQLVTGQVKSITGNEIVLDVGTYRSAQRSTASGQAGSQSGASSGRNAYAANRSGSAGGGSAARASTPAASASASFSMSQGSSSNSYVSGTSYAGERMGSNHSVTFTDQNGNALNDSAAGERSGSFGNGQMPGGNFSQGGSFPSGAIPSGGFENGSNSSSGSASGGQARPSGGNTGTGASGSGSNANANGALGANGFSMSRFQSSGQTMNLTIPVGTTVLATSSGTLTTTTFGKIVADDIIELIVQTDAGGGQTVLAAQIMG